MKKNKKLFKLCYLLLQLKDIIVKIMAEIIMQLKTQINLIITQLILDESEIMQKQQHIIATSIY